MLPLNIVNYWNPRIYRKLTDLPVLDYEVSSVQSQSCQLLMSNFNQDLILSIVLERPGGDQRRLERAVLDIQIGKMNRECSRRLESGQDPA